MASPLAPDCAALITAELGCDADRLEVSRPDDGYLHETWFVSDGDREIVVKRFDHTVVGDLTIRLHDLVANTALAGRIGIGAEVLRIDAPAHLVALAKLPGRALANEDLADPDVLARVARSLRRLHDAPALPANAVDFLAWSDQWLSSLRGVECGWTSDLHALHAELADARRTPASQPYRRSFVHNDLLLANFIDAGGATAVIDYDFSGAGSPHFDIGCLFGNAELAPARKRAFIEHYTAGEGDVETALARAELYEILAVHANAVVFTWAAYGYPRKFGPIAAEMDAVIADHVGRTRAAVSAGRHRELAGRIAPHTAR